MSLTPADCHLKYYQQHVAAAGIASFCSDLVIWIFTKVLLQNQVSSLWVCTCFCTDSKKIMITKWRPLPILYDVQLREGLSLETDGNGWIGSMGTIATRQTGGPTLTKIWADRHIRPYSLKVTTDFIHLGILPQVVSWNVAPVWPLDSPVSHLECLVGVQWPAHDQCIKWDLCLTRDVTFEQYSEELVS